MKIAITGKGGVGKTTLASLLAKVYAEGGHRVVAIDADPDANLASALGFSREEARGIEPIAGMHDLIEERTGMRPGQTGGYYKLNPQVDDIPDRFSAIKNDVRLLVMGTVKKGGGGCVCPESVLLKGLVGHLFLRSKEVVIMDMEAGVEHLGRATATGVDAFIVVVEPGQRSLQTAEAVRRLAADIGIDKTFVVGSKVKSADDRTFIRENLPDFEVLGFLSYSELVIEADLQGMAVFDLDAAALQEVREIRARLDELVGERTAEQARP